MVPAEALLHDMKFMGIWCHAFNRQNRLVGALKCQAVAGFDGPSIDQHRAGPALRRITSLVRSAQLAFLAQHIDQQQRWRYLEGDGPMVELQAEGDGFHGTYFNLRPEDAKAFCVASRSASVSCNKGRRTGPPC